MLSHLIQFSDLLNKFRLVKRAILVNGEDREENDMEHSFALAMTAWYIVTLKKLPLDLSKVITYALAHDLVEVYAGDTYIYSTNKDLLESKTRREREAAERLKKEFPEFSDLHDAIHHYELREDAESKFVYALDKIQPLINIYLDNGRNWKLKGVTLEMLVENKKTKTAISSEIKDYWEQIVLLFTKEEERLFPKRK